MRIYADFNGLQWSPGVPPKQFVPLDTLGSLRDLARAKIILTNGTRLTIYCDSSETEDLEAHAVARFDSELNCWVADIEDNEIREVPAQGHNSGFVCVGCEKALDQHIADHGLNNKSLCPSCGTLIHLPILSPKGKHL